MAPAVLLIGATLVFRGLGALGVDVFDTWLDSARVALALMFLFTAAAHFNRMKEDLIRMVLPSFPTRGRSSLRPACSRSRVRSGCSTPRRGAWRPGVSRSC